jgi:hypothetical protein
MSNEEEVVQPVEQRTADQPSVPAAPDPAGPPEPVGKNDPTMGMLTALGVGAVALGGLIVPAFLGGGATCGATRSAKIEWETRQRQVEQALAEEQAGELNAVAEPHGEGATFK